MAKFKVGDKVRVKSELLPNQFYGGVVFSIGMKEYRGIICTIESFSEDFEVYSLFENSFTWTEEMFEEVKEVKEMEKTYREVIADIEEGEVWDDGFLKIEMISGSISIGSLNGAPFKNVVAFVINPCRKFKLQRKEYTFEEAFKAYEEGKEIESESYKYKKCNGADCFELITSIKDEWIECEDGFEIHLDEIRGKWYIND